MKFKATLPLALLFVFNFAHAEVTLSGQVPSFEIRSLQSNIDRIWQFELASYFKGRAEIQPPEIYFSKFVASEESAEWRAWQKSWIAGNAAIWRDWVQASGMPTQEITKEWIDAHIETVFPFPPTFLAFHYDNTSKIQINPDATYLRFYQNDPYGVKRDTVGFGFYVTAHEMLHYLLENKGIPGRIHHCVFVTPGPKGTSVMADMADYLIREGIAGSLIQIAGVKSEEQLMPCEALSETERALAAKIAGEGI